MGLTSQHPHLGKTEFLIELREMRVRADVGDNRHVSREVLSRFFFREQSRKFEKMAPKCVMAKRGSPEHGGLCILTQLNEFTG